MSRSRRSANADADAFIARMERRKKARENREIDREITACRSRVGHLPGPSDLGEAA